MTLKETNPDNFFVKPARRTDGNFDFDECDNLLGRDYTQSNQIMPVRVLTTVGASAQEVKVTDGTELLAVNADGSINVVQSVGQMKIVSSGVVSNSTTTINTVGAGKVWRVYAAQMTAAVQNASHGLSDIAYLNSSAGKLIQLFTTDDPVTGAAISDNISLPKPIILTAGQTLSITVPQYMYASAVVFYEEVDA